MFDKDNKFGFIINNNENNNNIKDTNLPYTISSKVLTTVPAKDIKLGKINNINNVSINKDRRYYIEFLGSKKICSLLINEEGGNCIICSIGNYIIQAYNDSPNISMNINKINTNDTTATTFTDLIIYEEEVKYVDSKYLETDLVLQNSISMGRVGNIGAGSSAIGMDVMASGESSHAEGSDTTASGMSSHAEGDSSTASGYASHAEGSTTTASGVNSHAEGNCTTASGENSHAEGASTIASSQNQHVQGKYNIEDLNGTYAHIVGNGEDGKNSNAHTLDWKGNSWYAGKLSQEGTPTEDKDLTTKKYVDDNILLEQLPILRIDETNKRIYVNCNNMGTYKKYFVPNKYANVYGFSFIYTNEDSSETEIALIAGAMTRDDFILCARNTNTLFILILGGTDKYKYTKSTKTLEKGLYGYLKIGNTQEYIPTNDYEPATKKYVDDNKEYINYNDKLINNKITTLHISRNPVSCSTEINKKPLCELFPELLNMTYDTVFKKSISFKVNMDNFVKKYPTVKSAYNKIGINLYDENGNYIGNSYGSYINGDGLNIIYINTTQSIRFSAYFDKALAEGSNTSMETKNGYMTIQLSIPKGDNKKEFIDKIKDLKLSIIVSKTDFLNLNNESIYTPTSDYNPATKKYVDDKVTSLPQLSFNEAGELVVTINGVSKTFVPKE